MFDGSDGVGDAYPIEAVLMAQLRRLVSCLDIMMDASMADNQNPFSTGTLFIRPAKGKDRGQPYVCDKDRGLFVQRP